MNCHRPRHTFLTFPEFRKRGNIRITVDRRRDESQETRRPDVFGLRIYSETAGTVNVRWGF
jgi:hypothetical protein